MGNYNSQYENYYRSFINKNNNRINKERLYNGHNKLVNSNRSRKKFVIRRIIQDLLGVFVMLVFVIVCKFIVTPQTTAAYSYCKEVVNTNIDYKKIITKVKTIEKRKSVQDTMVDLIDKAKVKFIGGETIKQKIKEKFTLPTNGDIKKQQDGLQLQVSDKGKILASYDGIIKECGCNNELGNYILIDHGSGVESQYYSLNNVVVKKGKRVKKGDIIAENHSQDEKKYIGFKILFMGQSKGLERILGNKN